MTLQDKARFEIYLSSLVDEFNDAHNIRIEKISIDYDFSDHCVFVSLKDSKETKNHEVSYESQMCVL